MIVPVQLCWPNFDLTKFDSTKFKFLDTEQEKYPKLQIQIKTKWNTYFLTSEKTKLGCFLVQSCFALDAFDLTLISFGQS